MAIKYGNEIEYAREKLYGSVVAWGNTLVYVHEINSDGYCYITDLMGKEYTSVPLDDLNMEPITLGYVNLGRMAPYVSRMPARYYRQGLRSQTTVARCEIGGGGGLKFGKELLLSYRGIYPSLDKCVEYLYNQEKLSCAFSRIFGVRKYKEAIQLEYKSRKVGVVNCKTDEVILDNKYLFLEDALKPCL